MNTDIETALVELVNELLDAEYRGAVQHTDLNRIVDACRAAEAVLRRHGYVADGITGTTYFKP